MRRKSKYLPRSKAGELTETDVLIILLQGTSTQNTPITVLTTVGWAVREGEVLQEEDDSCILIINIDISDCYTNVRWYYTTYC